MHDDHENGSARNGGGRVFGDLEAAAQAFEQLPVMLVVTDGPELRTVAYNAQARAAVQDRFVQGQPVLESFARDIGGQGFAEMYGTPTATGRTVTFNESRVQLHQPDGSVDEMYFDAVFSPRLDADGRPRGTIVMCSDVTRRVLDRRAANSEVETLREKYAEARGSVRAMQRALLADSVPVTPSFDMAARYVLAADEAVAGGTGSTRWRATTVRYFSSSEMSWGTVRQRLSRWVSYAAFSCPSYGRGPESPRH